MDGLCGDGADGSHGIRLFLGFEKDGWFYGARMDGLYRHGMDCLHGKWDGWFAWEGDGCFLTEWMVCMDTGWMTHMDGQARTQWFVTCKGRGWMVSMDWDGMRLGWSACVRNLRTDEVCTYGL